MKVKKKYIIEEYDGKINFLIISNLKKVINYLKRRLRLIGIIWKEDSFSINILYFWEIIVFYFELKKK